MHVACSLRGSIHPFGPTAPLAETLIEHVHVLETPNTLKDARSVSVNGK